MKKIIAGLVASALLAGSMPALAGPYGPGRHYGPPVARHHHHGRGAAPLVLGLAGLALGSVLYAIAAPPVVAAPAPVPAPIVSQPPVAPAGQTWYYCEPYQAYYPNVPTCPEAWRPVPGY